MSVGLFDSSEVFVLPTRSGEAAVDRTEAAGAIKGVREAEAIDDVDVNEATSIGRRRPTTPVPPPDQLGSSG